MDDEQDLDRLLNSLSEEQMSELARQSGLFHPPERSAASRGRRLSTQFGHLRAAFIGNVEMPFLAFIVLLGVFLSGWLAASHFLDQWNLETERRVREESWNAAGEQFRLDLGRVRETREANEQFLTTLNEIVQALDAVRKERELEESAPQDQ